MHPRTLLADLAGRRSPEAEALRSEPARREFYADVLWHRPGGGHPGYPAPVVDHAQERQAALEAYQALKRW